MCHATSQLISPETRANRHFVEESNGRAISLVFCFRVLDLIVMTNFLPSHRNLSRLARRAVLLSVLCSATAPLLVSRPAQSRPLVSEQARADALLNRAARLYLAEKYSESLALCRQATQIAPNYPRAWVGFGTTLSALEQRDEAAVAFRQALKIGARGVDRTRAQNGLKKLGFSVRPSSKTASPVVPVRTITPFKSWKALRTFQVSPDGDRKSIARTIEEAPPYSRIEVAAGTYNEGLIVDKPLQIVGSKLGEVIVQNAGAPCLSLRTDGATVSRFVFKASLEAPPANTPTPAKNAAPNPLATPIPEPIGNRFHAVEIPKGRSLLSDCEIQTQSRVGISVYGTSTRSLVVRCKVSGARTSGIVVYSRARAEIDDCDVSDSAYAAVEVFEGGNAFLRNCRLNRNRTGAIAETTATVLLQGCVVKNNVWQGVRVEPFGSLFLRRTVVTNNAHNISRARSSVFASVG